MQKLYFSKFFLNQHSDAGFSLIEMLVVIVMVGVLAAIATPSWLNMMRSQRLGAAQDQALSAMREAQSKAKKEKRVWEACFRENTDPATGQLLVQWAVNRLNPTTPQCGSGFWQKLTEGNANFIAIRNDQGGTSPYTVQFKQDGGVVDPTNTTIIGAKKTLATQTNEQGKITFISRDEVANFNQNTFNQRCVIVSTTLGAIRTANDKDCN